MTDPVMATTTTHPAILDSDHVVPLEARVPEEAVAEFVGERVGEYDWDTSVGALAALRARKNGYRPVEVKKVYREGGDFIVRMEARGA